MHETTDDPLCDLNPQQHTAVTHRGGHLLVLAGAGSGKTRTIIARAEHLVRNGAEPHRVLALTFTRRAALELQQRLAPALGPVARTIPAGTFHWFALSTMRRNPRLFALDDATVIDKDDQESLMKLARIEHVAPNDKECPKADVLAQIYSYARNTDTVPEQYVRRYLQWTDEKTRVVLAIFRSYEDRKALGRYLDFDDILCRFADTIHALPVAAEQIKKRFDHILVDEFQDTNPTQARILDALKDPPRLYCVGDDAQSIYAFRGADFHNVHSFSKRFPGASTHKLTINYRSTQPILDLANWLLERSPLRYDKKLTAHRKGGQPPRLITFPNDLVEANWIAHDIQRRHAAGTPWGEHMVLVRTGWAGRTIEGALAQQRIPYAFLGGASLLEAAHVRDLLSLLRCATTHLDTLAWARYLPIWPGVGARKADRAIQAMQGCAHHDDALRTLDRTLPDRPQAAQGVRLVAANIADPPTAVRAAALHLAETLSNKYDNWDRRRTDFDLIEKLAHDQPTVHSLIETYTLDPVSSSAARKKAGSDVVTLITVHSAKGTESDVCYVAQAAPGMYPHTRSVGDADAEEEERRILYVALTRARDHLIITRAQPQNPWKVHDLPYLLRTVPQNLARQTQFPDTGEP